MNRFPIVRWIAWPLAFFLLLSACRGTPSPAPAVQDGWTQYEMREFAISLPSTWEVSEITVENAPVVYAVIEEVNPLLAQALGSPEVLQEISLWAYDAVGEFQNIQDNLNIQRSSLEGENFKDLQTILDVLQEEYTRSGVEITESELYRANDAPALKVAYHFSGSGSGPRIQVEGRQYFFVAGDNIWILSFTLDPAHLVEMDPVVDRSAGSFQPRP